MPLPLTNSTIFVRSDMCSICPRHENHAHSKTAFPLLHFLRCVMLLLICHLQGKNIPDTLFAQGFSWAFAFRIVLFNKIRFFTSQVHYPFPVLTSAKFPTFPHSGGSFPRTYQKVLHGSIFSIPLPSHSVLRMQREHRPSTRGHFPPKMVPLSSCTWKRNIVNQTAAKHRVFLPEGIDHCRYCQVKPGLLPAKNYQSK